MGGSRGGAASKPVFIFFGEEPEGGKEGWEAVFSADFKTNKSSPFLPPGHPQTHLSSIFVHTLHQLPTEKKSNFPNKHNRAQSKGNSL